MKSLRRSFWLLAGMCTWAGYAHAQAAKDTLKKAVPPAAKVAPKGPKPIEHELSGGIRLNSNGWGVYGELGKVKFNNTKTADMFYRVNFLQLELGEIRSPQQEKLRSEGNATGGTTKYIYGKINNFYTLKLGFGHRAMLAGKPDPGSVSIHWANVVSGSLGMMKPYYLNVWSDPNAIKYTEDTKNLFLSQRSIMGAAGFGTGLSEMKMVPGGHFKSMLHFDLPGARTSVLSLETGVSVDYYAEPITIMANRDLQQLFVDFFMAIQFGKRW